MIIRIDDYNKQNHNIIMDLIYYIIKYFPGIKIILGIIPSDIDNHKILELLNIFGRNILLAFHGYYHLKTEFNTKYEKQLESFVMGKVFFDHINYNPTIFIPPYNIFNTDTINLLNEYKYTTISIDYKNFFKNKDILGGFKIYETNYFFNKKNKYLGWYIDNIEKIDEEIDNLISNKINIGVEIHPEYIKTQDDISKFYYLINKLKSVTK